MLLCRQGCFNPALSTRLRLFGPTARQLKVLEVLKPVLLHAHFGMDACTALSMAHALSVPLVVTFHGWDATTYDQVFRWQSIALNLYVRRYKKLAEAATRVLCVSEFIRRKVIAKGFSEEKTTVHYTGINLREFTPQAINRDPIILFVGRLVAKKGCEYLIRAMRLVQEHAPEAELVVIGDGPMRGSLEQLANSQLRKCRFLGALPPNVVRQWMNRASVFSVPSVVTESGDAEGFGMVFAEAQAMGLPVASFASGGIPEAVKDGETGLLAAERDVEALSANLVLLLKSDSMRQRFREAGRRRVCELFDIEKQAVKLENIYADVVQLYAAGRIASQ